MKLVHISQKSFMPATHEDPRKPGVLKKVLFNGKDFDADCGLRMLNYAVIQPGEAFALHSHETLEEVFYVLSGKGRITVGKETAEIGPEMAVIIPKLTDHIMKNTGTEPLVYLAFGASREMGRTITPSLKLNIA